VGVTTYSVISGSITSIIINYEVIGNTSFLKHSILNRLLEQKQITTELFNEMKIVVQQQEQLDNKEDIIEFIDDLPLRFQIKTVMYVYR